MNSKFYSSIKNLYFQYGIQPLNFNLFGIRNAERQKEDIWNDYIGFFTDIEPEIYIFKGTTDPSIYWSLNSENINGVAHLCLGYHKDIWTIDKHKGLYTALCNRWNCNPTRIWRDVNKDTVYNQSIDKLEVGRFGLNCHRADALKIITQIGKYSAGCQVVQDPNNYNFLIDKAIESSQRKFSYFLFNKYQIDFFDELEYRGLN